MAAGPLRSTRRTAGPRWGPRTIPHRRENETTFTVEWKGRYRIEGTAFVYMDLETGTIHGSDRAKEDVKIEASPELAAMLNPKRQ